MTRQQLEYLLAYIDVHAQVDALKRHLRPYAKEQDRMERLRKALYATVEPPESRRPSGVGEGGPDDMSQDY